MKRPSKYQNVRTVYDGVRYDSRAEARRAAELDLLVKIGEITGWTRQVTFRLGCPENTYRVDFLVFGVCNGKQVVWAEDVKGVETQTFKRNKRLWARYGPCPLHILKTKGQSEIVGID
jgi:hypothetical protein